MTDASPIPTVALRIPSELLSAEHACWLASRLSPDRAHRFTPTNPPGGGTVYLCAADADGMMVSLIESNYMGFGSGVMGGSTGIMLQNRGAYFSLDPAHPNALAPRSRTLHTLMPGMLLRDGRAEVALGAMGGDGQPQTMVQLVQGSSTTASTRRRRSTGRAGWPRRRRPASRSAR